MSLGACVVFCGKKLRGGPPNPVELIDVRIYVRAVLRETATPRCVGAGTCTLNRHCTASPSNEVIDVRDGLVVIYVGLLIKLKTPKRMTLLKR